MKVRISLYQDHKIVLKSISLHLQGSVISRRITLAWSFWSAAELKEIWISLRFGEFNLIILSIHI